VATNDPQPTLADRQEPPEAVRACTRCHSVLAEDGDRLTCPAHGPVTTWLSLVGDEVMGVGRAGALVVSEAD
jgi:hypothetical protein